jgi:hypothetical protein
MMKGEYNGLPLEDQLFIYYDEEEVVDLAALAAILHREPLPHCKMVVRSTPTGSDEIWDRRLLNGDWIPEPKEEP